MVQVVCSDIVVRVVWTCGEDFFVFRPTTLRGVLKMNLHRCLSTTTSRLLRSRRERSISLMFRGFALWIRKIAGPRFSRRRTKTFSS